MLVEAVGDADALGHQASGPHECAVPQISAGQSAELAIVRQDDGYGHLCLLRGHVREVSTGVQEDSSVEKNLVS